MSSAEGVERPGGGAMGECDDCDDGRGGLRMEEEEEAEEDGKTEEKQAAGRAAEEEEELRMI